MNNANKNDSVSMLRASNARLAALVGDSSRAAKLLSEARQASGKALARPIRKGGTR